MVECRGLLLQYETVKNILKLMSKPAVAEQAGRIAIENCITVLVLSLAAVSTSTLCTSILVFVALLTLLPSVL